MRCKLAIDATVASFSDAGAWISNADALSAFTQCGPRGRFDTCWPTNTDLLNVTAQPAAMLFKVAHLTIKTYGSITLVSERLVAR